jgi:probable phosphoglycerate mutase
VLVGPLGLLIAAARKPLKIRSEVPNCSIWDAEIRDGESLEQVSARAQRVIEIAAAARGDVALFSHGYMLRILTACWLGLPRRSGRPFALEIGGVSVLGHERETRVILRWNWRI